MNVGTQVVSDVGSVGGAPVVYPTHPSSFSPLPSQPSPCSVQYPSQANPLHYCALWSVAVNDTQYNNATLIQSLHRSNASSYDYGGSIKHEVMESS